MRPTLFLAIQYAKWYRKKHNIPDEVPKIDDEWVRRTIEDNENLDHDCLGVEEKLRKGLQIEKTEFPDCCGWMIRSVKNPSDKVLYYIHGGAFVGGYTRGSFRFISFAVRNFGYNVFSVDYRLAPKFTCIDAIGDCEDGYRHLLKTYDPKNIILIGESAGGNLVFSLSHKLKDDGLPLPGGIVSCSPVVQFLHYAYSYYECACKTDFGITFGINQVVEYYRGELPVDSPYVSPLLGDLSGFPPVYLDASDCESLRDEARMMYVRLKEEGTDVEYHELRDFFHAMLTRPRFGYVRREEYPHIIRFINRVFKARS